MCIMCIICIYIYIYIYICSRGWDAVVPPICYIFYVAKGVIACTRVYVLNNMCSHAGESTISSHDLTDDCQTSALMQARAPCPCLMSHSVGSKRCSRLHESMCFSICIYIYIYIYMCIPVHTKAPFPISVIFVSSKWYSRPRREHHFHV